MKHLLCLLPLALLFSGCIGDTAKPLLQKSPYDADFNYHAKRVSNSSAQTKHLKKMEAAFQSAQKADLVAVDSMLQLDKPDRWLYINAYHRRMQERQQKVLALPAVDAKDGYKPDYLIIDNLAERETASRKASAQYLYEQSAALLAEGTHKAAREAYAFLTDLQENYYPVWEDSQILLDSAAQIGVEHVLIEGACRPNTFFLDSKWQKFYQNPLDRPSFDIIIQAYALNVIVSPEEETTYTYTETADVEVGYVEKRDSSGAIIERSPVYEPVSATVTETTVQKYADATVDVDIFDGPSGVLIYSTRISASSDFNDRYTKITGDRRALSTDVTESLFSIFTPTDWAMEDKVVDALNSDFARFVHGQLWTDN